MQSGFLLLVTPAWIQRPNTVNSICIDNPTNNTAKLFFNNGIGNLCASFAPNGAVKKLILAIANTAGQ